MKQLEIPVICVLIILTCGLTCRAHVEQAWLVRYDRGHAATEEVYDFCIDERNNIYITGSNYLTQKYNTDGTLLFSRSTYPTFYAGYARGMEVDPIGNIYITGYLNLPVTDEDYLTMKLGTNGNLLWASWYNGAGDWTDRAYDIAIDAYGNVLVTGRISTIPSWPTGSLWATIKYDSSGSEQWIATYDYAGFGGYAEHIETAADGSIYVVGKGFLPEDWWADIVVIKYDSNGQEEWVTIYTSPGYEDGHIFDAKMGFDDALYMTGYTYSEFSKDLLTIRCNSEGSIQLFDILPGTNEYNEEAYAITLDDDGNVYVCGVTSMIVPNEPWNALTVKYDSDGHIIWTDQYNGRNDDNDLIQSIAVDLENNVYVTGYTSVVPSYPSLLTIKYDLEGGEEWVMTYTGPGNPDGYGDEGKFIGMNDSCEILVAGRSDSSEIWPDNGDYILIKYVEVPGLELSLSTSGPVVFPPSGGELEYSATVANVGNRDKTAGFWIELRSPENTVIETLVGPIENLNFMAGYFREYNQVYTISPHLEPGEYELRACLGEYDSESVYTQGRLTFTKNPTSYMGNTQDRNFGLYMTLSPNPFNPLTTINFSLPEAADVTLTVFDLQGRRVAELVNGNRDAGNHTLTFDGSSLASGVYIYCLRAGDFQANGKMVLMK